MNMRALDRPLQQRPETLDTLHMMFATNPLLLCMIDGTMLIASSRQRGVGLQFVGADGRALLDVGQNMRLQRRAAHISDNARHEVAAALHHAEHRGFSSSTAPALAGSF